MLLQYRHSLCLHVHLSIYLQYDIGTSSLTFKYIKMTLDDALLGSPNNVIPNYGVNHAHQLPLSWRMYRFTIGSPFYMNHKGHLACDFCGGVKMKS